MSTFWEPLRQRTPARIGLDRAGDAARTRHVLESAEATARHAAGVLAALLPELPGDLTVGPPVIATQARVALADHVGAAQRARLCLVVIGERPGLSAHDSLGAYLTWAPAPGTADSARNCVSNIRRPHGLGHADAARTLARLIAGARRIEATGVQLKDTSGLLTDE